MLRAKNIHQLISWINEGGKPLFENLKFYCENNFLNVVGWTNMIYLENVTKEIAEEEVRRIKSFIQQLSDNNLEFKKFLQAKEIVYTLCYDDSGKVGIQIYKEENGNKKFYLGSSRN